MLLSKPDLKKAVRDKKLIIRRPLPDGAWWYLDADSDEHDEKWFQEASIDLTLDTHFARVKPDYQPADAWTFELTRIDPRRYRVEGPEPYVILKPSETILGWTAERVSIPLNLCGWIEGKSGPARKGLIVHFTAPHIAPGYGLGDPQRIQLEIANFGDFGVQIFPGDPIAQLMLMELSSPVEEGYSGQFAHGAS